MKQTAVEWYIDALKQWDLCYMESNGKISKEIYESTKISLQEQAKAMEKEQNESILNYIKEVRDLCDKLRFPTEEELRELVIKADNILLTFKSE